MQESQSHEVVATPRIRGALDEDRRPERIEDYKLPSALLIHEALRVDGEEELARSASSLCWSGLTGGLTMGLSMVGAGLLGAHLPEAPWKAIVTSFGFTLGFIVVMVGRQGLITENTLTAVLPVLTRPSAPAAARALRQWGLVLAFNVVGALAFSAVTARTGIFPEPVRHEFSRMGLRMLDASVGTQFLRAVLAGWLIALALWLSPALGAGRLVAIFVLTWLVSFAGFGHVISGSVEVLFAVFSGDASFWSWLGRYLLPVLLGNLCGGVFLVAVLNHLQVAREQRTLFPELRRRPAG